MRTTSWPRRAEITRRDDAPRLCVGRAPILMAAATLPQMRTQLGRPDAAAASLEAAAELNPTNGAVIAELGDALRATGQLDEARRSLLGIARRDVYSSSSLLALGRAAAAMAEVPPPQRTPTPAMPRPACARRRWTPRLAHTAPLPSCIHGRCAAAVAPRRLSRRAARPHVDAASRAVVAAGIGDARSGGAARAPRREQLERR